MVALKNFLLIVSSFLFFLKYSNAQDTLYVHVQGEFNKSEKFRVRYKDKLIGSFDANNSEIKTSFVIDTNGLNPYSGLNLQILKYSRLKRDWVPLKYYFIYYPDFNHILLYYRQYDSKKYTFSIYYLPYYIPLCTFD